MGLSRKGETVPQADLADLKPMTRDRWIEIVEQSGDPKMESRDRRQNPRYNAGTVVTLVFDPEQGSEKAPRELTSSVLDISPTGMMLRCHWEIPHDTPVGIKWYQENDVEALSGIVRHCTSTVGAFKVGIELRFS
ncbi:MAG TPA: PilZ domain-containing protein [Phycisphaerae bacterium]|nr:PilZ domain-containing protein [Phycisphaerae bacterium]